MISKELKSEEKISYFFVIAALLYLAVTVFDSILRYTPVPCADSWDGILGFINNYPNHGFSYWLYQHNEHRIFISRIFFWLNYMFFDAQNWPLIILNYILASASFLIFLRMIKTSFDLKKTNKDKEIQNFIKSFIIFMIFLMSFSKMQGENFDWEFQSQFFLAHLFPLISLYFLGKSAIDKQKSNFLFTTSCIFGILSAGTMANGVFALPAMAFLAILLRMELRKILTLSFLSILILILYLQGYQKPSAHSSFESLYQPLEIFLYIISYYGLIFKFAVGKIGCRIFGILFLILLAKNLWRVCKKEEKSWINIVLISFICYIALTGLISAIGRAGSFGYEQAYSGRYSTPILMAWIGFLIIYKDSLVEFAKKSNRNKYLLLLLPLSLFIYQIKKIDVENSSRNVFEKNVSALAVELNVRDIIRLTKDKNGGAIHQNYSDLLRVTDVATKNDISIFNYPLIKDIGKEIGGNIEDTYCRKRINSVANISKINDGEKFYFIQGLIKNDKLDKEVKSFYLSDNEKIIGYVILNHDKKIFKGYSLYSEDIYLYDNINKCKIKTSE